MANLLNIFFTVIHSLSRLKMSSGLCSELFNHSGNKQSGVLIKVATCSNVLQTATHQVEGRMEERTGKERTGNKRMEERIKERQGKERTGNKRREERIKERKGKERTGNKRMERRLKERKIHRERRIKGLRIKGWNIEQMKR